MSYLVLDASNVILAISPDIAYQENGNVLIKGGTIAIPPVIFKQVVQVDSIPSNVVEVQYCYSADTSFSINPNYVAPGEISPAYDPNDLASVQAHKINQIKDTCQQTIFAGTDISDSKGTEHFGMTLEDQTNLSALAAAVAAGAASVPYHADGQLCRAFAAAEFTAVYSAAKLFVAQNTTLCNHLMVWVQRCTTTEDVEAITYTSKLPDDLQTNYDTIMASLTGSSSAS